MFFSPFYVLVVRTNIEPNRQHFVLPRWANRAAPKAATICGSSGTSNGFPNFASIDRITPMYLLNLG